MPQFAYSIEEKFTVEMFWYRSHGDTVLVLNWQDMAIEFVMDIDNEVAITEGSFERLLNWARSVIVKEKRDAGVL